MFFYPVCSVKTTLSRLEYIQLLIALRTLNPQFLVSAFDLARADETTKITFEAELARANDCGCTVLMDSGNYESYWKVSQASWQQKHFHEAMVRFPCAIAFSFDEQQP